MSSMQFPKRILIIGGEVGPIARLLKSYKLESLKLSIGAIDILGNVETRIFSDWTFSVEKQSPNESIFRQKQRPLIDLLYELTLIMLEEKEFDLLIPMSPFQTKPRYLRHLSKEVPVMMCDIQSLECVNTNYAFLKTLSSKIPEALPDPVRFSDLIDSTSISFPFFFISKNKTDIFRSQEQLISISDLNKSGYYLPFAKVNCALFMSSSDSLVCIGIQSLSPPSDHDFIPTFLEKNALLPFLLPKNVSFHSIISFLTNLINTLELRGIVSIYFGFLGNKIIPISCNILPDENIELWNDKSSNNLFSYLFSFNTKDKPISPANYGFKLPIYSSHSIRVPKLPDELVRQQNLPHVFSHSSYPICSILGNASTLSKLDTMFHQKKKEILNILRVSS